MARRLIQYTEITDDLDGNPAEETIELAVDGQLYVLDLTTAHAKELREFLNPYLEAAHDKRKVPRVATKPARKAPAAVARTSGRSEAHDAMMNDRKTRKKIREWARQNGYAQGDTGRILAEAVLAYRDHHPRTHIPEKTLKDAEDTINFKQESDAASA